MLDQKELDYWVQICERNYHRFWISKSSGGRRMIYSPSEPLKEYQRKILAYLRKEIKLSVHTTCCTGRGLVANALYHQGRKVVMVLDIRDFYPSISKAQVRQALSRTIPPPQASVVAKICTVEGFLPIGAPTSPYLADLVCLPMDNELACYCLHNNATYTRYVDDITISSDASDANGLLLSIERMIAKRGFRLNHHKTHIQRSSNRQLVTGIVVNQGLSLPRERVRALRAELHQIRTGQKVMTPADSNRIGGLISYIHAVSPDKGQKFLAEFWQILHS